MKKFFMTNLFLASAIAFTVFYAVDSSFITFTKDTNLEIQTDNIAELERAYLAKLELISSKKLAPVAVRVPIKEIKKVKRVTKIIVPTKTIKAKKVIAKKPTVKALPVVSIKLRKEIKKSNIELSFKDLPEQKRIQLKKIKHVAWTKLDLKLKNYEVKAYAKKLNVNTTDRISTALSATEKSPVKNSELALNSKTEVKANSVSSGKDELVFFDYGTEPTKGASEFQKESPVKKVVSKLNPEKVVTTQKSLAQDSFIKDIQKEFSTPSKAMGVVSNFVPKPTAKESLIKDIKKEYSKPNPAKDMVAKVDLKPFIERKQQPFVDPKPKAEADHQCLNDADIEQDEVFKTKYSLSLLEVDYKRSGYNRINNFELQFHDDANLYKEDFGSGEINIEFKMNSQISIRRATILSRGYYPTTLDMVFEPGEVQATIPVFSLDAFNKLINQNNLRGFGAHTLIELDDKTEDVEIDISKKYEAKFYLDKEFNVVSRLDSAYSYVLFIGVEAGNAILNFKRSDLKIINKLVYLAKDQIFYEPNFYAEIKSDIFSFYREGVLTKCKSLINIDPSKVNPWNYKGSVVKESLNSVKLSNMIYPVGSKKYVEVKYDELKETIFVGRWGHENIVVPTEGYISHVLNQFGNQATSNSCIMQLNIEKPVKTIAFNGQSSDQNMDMQIRILDSDGEFYQDFSEKSERVFLMGQEEGTVNISINYVDGSTQYLQSFCSDATYIVEQL